MKRLTVPKAGTFFSKTLGKIKNGRSQGALPSPKPRSVDRRIGADIVAYLLTRFPESFDIAPLEERIRSLPERGHVFISFLESVVLIEHAYEEAEQGRSHKELREDAARAFANYDGASRYLLLLADEKYQLLMLQEMCAVELSHELLHHTSPRALQTLVDAATADSILKGVVVGITGLSFEEAEEKFLQLPPEWLRLVNDTLALLNQALFNELSRLAGEAAATGLLERCVKEVGEGLSSLPAFHSLLRAIPAGALGAGYLESMSRTELEREVKRRTDELLRKTREQEALIAENKRLAAFPENSPNPIVGLSREGKITYANPAAESLKEEGKLSSIESLLPAAHESYFNECVLSNKVMHAEIEVGDRAFEWTYAPFLAYDAVHLYATDITNKKQLQELLAESDRAGKMLVRKDRELTANNESLMQLNNELTAIGRELVKRDVELTEANRRLTELDQMKSEFVSVAAHQLRTPLTGIRWTLQALADKDLGELTAKQEMFAKTALKTVVGAVSLINDLLSVARMEEGRFMYDLKPADIVAVTRRSVLRFMTPAAEKGVSLSASIDAAPPEIPLDAEKIEMCIDNLIDNAIKYTDAGGKVVVGMTADAEKVRINISDTGVGIPTNERFKIFSKFFRAHNAQLLHTAGTGLGLYIVKKIVERHQGHVDFESVEGKGTTFTITLPIPKK